MQNIDVSNVERIIREVAEAEIMPRFKNLAATDVETKLDSSAVTVADKAAENAYIARLTDYLPGSVVVGEESFEADPAIISRFGGSDYVWVIDPIDGTSNFISGNPQFGSMVALVRNRSTVASWIYDPNTSDMLSAEQGSGVWLRGARMRLAGQDNDRPKTGIIGSRLKKILSKPEVARVLAQLPTMQTGSAAAFDYGRLFVGDDNITFASSQEIRVAYLLYRQSKPWDHVPGLFMLKEAKGFAADFQSRPYDMGLNEGLLVAPSEQEWTTFHSILSPALGSFALP